MNVNSGGLITSASTGAANNLGSLLLSNNGAAAILNINTGGTVTLSGTASTAGLDVARGASSTGAGTGTVNLNGGTLTTARSFSGTSLASNATATSTFNFNGGTLTADVTNNTDFMKGLTRANVRDGGAVIDTKTFNVTIGQALLHSNVAGNNPNTGAPDSATDGGLTKMSAGTLTLTGVNTYNGPTAINGGTLALSTGSLAGTAVTAGGASTNGTLQVNGGYTIGSSGSATLTLAANTGAVSLLDTTVNTLTINNATAGATAFTVGGGDTLSFDAGASTGDEINLGAGLLATATGSNTVNINVLARPAGTQTLTLINAPGGFTGSSDFTLGTVTGVVTSANSFGLMLALNSTANQLQLVETATAAPATAYFTGSLGASWNANNGTIGNFSTDSAGTVGVTQLPGATTDVHFYATNANTTNVAASTLDAAFTIKTLTVDGSTLGESNPVGIAPGTGGSLTITPTDPATGITVNSGAGAVTISAPVTLGAPQTWTNNSASLLAVSGAVTNGANTLTLAGSGNTTLSGVIGAGAGGLTMNGMGTLTLSAANTYTGATTITAGTVKNGITNAVPVTTALTVSGGTYDLNGFGDGVASLSDGGSIAGTVTNSSATAAAISTNGTVSTTFSGLISGNLSLLQQGNSTLTVSAANNSYANGTTIGAGQNGAVVRAAASGALGTGTVSFDAGGNSSTARLELIGGITLTNTIGFTARNNASVAIENISGNNTLSGPIAMGTGGGNYNVQSDAGLLTLAGNFTPPGSGTRTLFLTGAGNGVISGALQFTTGNIFGVTDGGTGTWTLTGASSYTGATAINSGATLQVGDGTTGHDGTIGNSSSVTDNGTLIYNRFGIATAGYVISGSGGVTVSTGAGGAGVQTLTGGNTYMGATTINSGATLQVGNGASGGDGTIANTSGVTDNGTLIYNRFGTATASYVISGMGAVSKLGAGTQTFSAANTYAGGTTVVAGMLTVSAGASLGSGSVTVSNGSGTAGLTLTATAGTNTSDAIANTATLTLNVNGTLTLTGVNGTVQETVGGLVVNGTTELPGLYGSTSDPTLGVNDLASITGTGELLVLATVPEPSTNVMLWAGLSGLAGLLIRRRRKV